MNSRSLARPWRCPAAVTWNMSGLSPERSSRSGSSTRHGRSHSSSDLATRVRGRPTRRVQALLLKVPRVLPPRLEQRLACCFCCQCVDPCMLCAVSDSAPDRVAIVQTGQAVSFRRFFAAAVTLTSSREPCFQKAKSSDLATSSLLYQRLSAEGLGDSAYACMARQGQTRVLRTRLYACKRVPREYRNLVQLQPMLSVPLCGRAKGYQSVRCAYEVSHESDMQKCSLDVHR